MVEEMRAARGICATYETVRQWGKKFAKTFADRIRQRAPARGDKWHLDEVVVSIAGERHWLWRAVDQNGFVLDVVVQRRRDTRAAQRLLRRLLKSAVTPPRVMITDKLRSYGAARAKMGLFVEQAFIDRANKSNPRSLRFSGRTWSRRKLEAEDRSETRASCVSAFVSGCDDRLRMAARFVKRISPIDRNLHAFLISVGPMFPSYRLSTAH
jgi:putative transposase